MSKLFWGFFFIFINVRFTVNAHTLGVLPAFAGYILLLGGMKDLREESDLFRGIRPFAVVMAVYTGILWVGALLGVGASSGWLGTLLSLLAMAVSLYVSWAVVQGVLDMEARRGTDLNAAAMRRAWIVLAAAQAASYALLFLFPLLAVAGVVIALIGAVMLLAAIWRGKRLYEALPSL